MRTPSKEKISVTKIVTTVMTHLDVSDMNIYETDIESIIKDIYQDGQKI